MYKKGVIGRLHSRLKTATEWVIPLPFLVNLKLNKNIEAVRNVRILHIELKEFEVIDMTNIFKKLHIRLG